MLLARRGLLGTLLAAPAIIRTPGLLMPVKAATPDLQEWRGPLRQVLINWQTEMMQADAQEMAAMFASFDCLTEFRLARHGLSVATERRRVRNGVPISDWEPAPGLAYEPAYYSRSKAVRIA